MNAKRGEERREPDDERQRQGEDQLRQGEGQQQREHGDRPLHPGRGKGRSLDRGAPPQKDGHQPPTPAETPPHRADGLEPARHTHGGCAHPAGTSTTASPRKRRRTTEDAGGGAKNHCTWKNNSTCKTNTKKPSTANTEKY